MKKRCVILAAGAVWPGAAQLMQPGDYLIACDAGYLHAEALGLTPNLVLGDFDSAPQPAGANVLVLPAEKDDTDTHYAARIAAEKGFQEVLLLGGLGGARMEHSLANLATGLWLEKQGIKAQIASQASRLRFVLPGTPVQLEHQPDCYFSLFPLEGAAQGVQVSGAKYPLQNACITPDYPVGTSNETLPGKTTIQVKSGSLLLIVTQKEGAMHQNTPAGI